MSDHKYMVVSGEKIQRLEEIKNQLLKNINDEQKNEESDLDSFGKYWFLIGNQEVLSDIDEFIIKEKRNIVSIDYGCYWESYEQINDQFYHPDNDPELEPTPETSTIKDHLEANYPEWRGLCVKTTRERVQESMLERWFSHISKKDREGIVNLINH